MSFNAYFDGEHEDHKETEEKDTVLEGFGFAHDDEV